MALITVVEYDTKIPTPTIAKEPKKSSNEILNAFKYNLTNGPTEGFNNNIKVLKEISYGIRDFERFRTRILHS